MENEKYIGPDSPVEDRLQLAINMTQTLLEMGVLDGHTEEFLLNNLQRITGGERYVIGTKEVEYEQVVNFQRPESLLPSKKLEVKVEISDVATGKKYTRGLHIELENLEDTEDQLELHDGVEALSNELNDYMDGMYNLTDLFKEV